MTALISLSSSSLDRTLLFSIKTSTGILWAYVTEEEAMTMIAHGDALRGAFPDAEERLPEVQDIIDDGHIAEGLLFGHLNADCDVDEDSICDDCRADEDRMAVEPDASSESATEVVREPLA